MLSGIRPRGNSSTPVSGKIGMTGGSASKLRSNGEPVTGTRSRKQDRGEPLAGGDGEGIRRPHRLEEFEQLLARGLLVPGAVAADDLEELVDASLALARGEERGGELVARLEILGVALDPGLELAQRALGLAAGLGELQARARGGDLGMARAFLGRAVERLLGALEVVARDIGAREARDRVDIVGLMLQHLGEDGGGAAVVAVGNSLLRHLHSLLDRRRALGGARGEPLDELLDLALR